MPTGLTHTPSKGPVPYHRTLQAGSPHAFPVITLMMAAPSHDVSPLDIHPDVPAPHADITDKLPTDQGHEDVGLLKLANWQTLSPEMRYPTQYVNSSP
jgi:hypothetical protein